MRHFVGAHIVCITRERGDGRRIRLMGLIRLIRLMGLMGLIRLIRLRKLIGLIYAIESTGIVIA